MAAVDPDKKTSDVSCSTGGRSLRGQTSEV
jgi:hypothetical protein